MNIKTEITKLHYDRSASGFIFNFLRFCSIFYKAGCELKNFLYDKKILQQRKVNAYVISVGNITTGGVGKTPVVAELAKYFLLKGQNVAIVSRGYGGKLSNKQINIISDGKSVYYNARLAGDEPYWLATNTKAVVVTCKNRVKASEYVIKNFGITTIIMDDGFQHRKLYRDLDIVLIDSEKMFGNGNLLPAGPLREDKKFINRADRLVIVSKNCDHSKSLSFVDEVQNEFGIPAILCKAEPDYIYNIKTGAILPEGSKIIAMSAIGQPEQFFDFLNKYEIIDKVVYEDHHQYSEQDIVSKNDNIVTTEKDAVKLSVFNADNIYALKLKTSIDFEELSING